MTERDAGFVGDIVGAARRIAGFIAGQDLNSFIANPEKLSATVHQLMIIGEATKRLSTEFRAAHSSVPWSEIAGMRDVLIHDYRETEHEEVWRTATVDVPVLLEYLLPLLPPEKKP